MTWRRRKRRRKFENKHIANFIVVIQIIKQRVIVSDIQESFIWVCYKCNKNQLIIFADDTYPRWVTTSCLLYYDTVAEKFGNICVKAEVIRNYHVGETVLSLQKTSLIPGGSESLVYTTLSRGIGILVPFTSHEDHNFFLHVEMYLRYEHPRSVVETTLVSALITSQSRML
ncbi:splicing factor 3B subunit 3 isoform X2 [Pelobates cultripes]|uniref:Splicing factor 3B subunit 3 isoform X2 n=1 Tax=Pelobates cultripes TaxID=61616 RepID=A0AAD1RYM3_PELCU|nr:splicing factor 3B subunit 3 isoform X2 [Pelobates cultripes]